MKCAKPERHGRPAGSRAHFLELNAPDTTSMHNAGPGDQRFVRAYGRHLSGIIGGRETAIRSGWDPLAGLAATAAEMGHADVEVLAFIAPYLELWGLTSAPTSERPRSVGFPQPLDEPAEVPERRRPIEEMLTQVTSVPTGVGERLVM